MNSKFVVIAAIAVCIYLITSTMNYNLEYKTQELKNKTKKNEQMIDEMLIEERINLSREEAMHEYGLELNNNWYYLKEEDE